MLEKVFFTPYLAKIISEHEFKGQVVRVIRHTEYGLHCVNTAHTEFIVPPSFVEKRS